MLMILKMLELNQKKINNNLLIIYEHTLGKHTE